MPGSLLSTLLSGLQRLGYRGTLLEKNYKFRDWFSPTSDEREIAVAAFGQTPVSHESACIGVAIANGARGAALVDHCRALGAPVILEIDGTQVREWMVSRSASKHELVGDYAGDRISELFVSRAADWKPEALLRAKNIGTFHWAPQLSLFAGLLPELEEEIQKKLEPLLRDALSTTKHTYEQTSGKQPDPAQLFKLVFWMLTAKVFHDRRVGEFVDIEPTPDALLAAVAKQYHEKAVPRLLNREAREAAARRIWANLDFRNLSVEVLSQIWSTTLVDDETKRLLGIHRTSRTIVRYMVERMRFGQNGDDNLIILEPCCGSAVFLIGAMGVLRNSIIGMPSDDRHQYFVERLVGLENDPFAVEISRLALTLADFPYPGDWRVAQSDIFSPGTLTEYLQASGVVLCNPPFQDFTEDERRQYRPKFVKKPAELLFRVLSDLHPSGIIGFVLPRLALDGNGYAEIRKLLVERFAQIDLTELPDRAFDADHEVILLIAQEPIPHDSCRVTSKKVEDSAQAWARFEIAHEVTSEHVLDFTVQEASRGLNVPDLPDVWDFLVNYPSLGEFSEIHRGIEWTLPLTGDGRETGNRSRLVKDRPESGYRPGVPPRARFNAFQVPRIKYLSLRPEDQRTKAFRQPWDSPKVILNKATKSRGRWRIAAFADLQGLTCYQSCAAVWLNTKRFDEFVLAAILNSPIANAFVATREGKVDIKIATLKRIPMPHLSEGQLQETRSLVKRYQSSIAEQGDEEPERLLKQIDASILDGYRMPPRLERQLLDWFRGQQRPVSHEFSDYFPQEWDLYFSLSDYLRGFEPTMSDRLLGRLSTNRPE